MQSRLGSIVESIANILVGVVIAYLAGMFIWHRIGVPVTHSQNLIVTLFMTGVSFVRSYFLRRIFNALKTSWNSGVASHDN